MQSDKTTKVHGSTEDLVIDYVGNGSSEHSRQWMVHRADNTWSLYKEWVIPGGKAI